MRFSAGLERDSARLKAHPRMKSGFCSATALNGNSALPFVIPSEAEGSAVLQARPGNVFRQSTDAGRGESVPRLRRSDNVGNLCPSLPGLG